MVPGIQPRIEQDIQKGHKALEEVEQDFVQMNKEMERFRRLDVKTRSLFMNLWELFAQTSTPIERAPSRTAANAQKK
jgi:hypothetical protein